MVVTAVAKEGRRDAVYAEWSRGNRGRRKGEEGRNRMRLVGETRGNRKKSHEEERAKGSW